MSDDAVREIRFANRHHAGRLLAERLRAYAGRDDVLVLGLPRGGVPVAYEVAKSLGAALDIFVVRKLGVPQQPELAMGAIASGGVRVLNEDVVQWYRIPQGIIEAVARDEERELTRRERGNRERGLAKAGRQGTRRRGNGTFGAVLFDELAHPLDEPFHGVPGLTTKPPHRPDDVVSTSAFLRRDVIIGVHRADQKREKRLVHVKPAERRAARLAASGR
jgi:hypothetical protein